MDIGNVGVVVRLKRLFQFLRIGVDSMDIIKKAFDFARLKHKGQLDDDGLDYFSAHCLHVAEIVRLAGGSDEMIAAALLHDVIEDTDTTYYDLLDEFGMEVANLVKELTHEGTKDHYGRYFPNLKSREAIIIKMADRMSNLLRMGSWSEKRQAHYLKKSMFWKDGSDRKS